MSDDDHSGSGNSSSNSSSSSDTEQPSPRAAAGIHLFRAALPQYRSIEDAADLFEQCENIVVLTGAGVSVSCGIPDFRSAGGVYDQVCWSSDGASS